MSNKVVKWKRWLDVASHDCANVLLSRDMFRDLHRMIEKNPKMQQADYFHEYMEDTYVAHVLMMVRKHLKRSSDSISLAALASDLHANRAVAPDTNFTDEIRIKLDQFEQNAKKLESFADRVIAHSDKRKPSYTPTFDDVEKAIDAMDKLCVQCSSALAVDYNATCKPTVQYGWLMIFREMGIET
ncbi:AbiU2 domain-containing protein [Xanthomonas sp. GW]|uniref:AbiU2 domain-containing protein n=1 Tax=Xanthomonas sp. GW TaxID=2724121 RepID=UPI00163B0BFD|nr:hypothetical protein [Xanthomonas sp. GW]